MITPEVELLCTGITLIEAVTDTLSALNIEFENDDTETVMFGNYTEVIDMLNKKVLVSFREDLWHGKLTRVINSITRVTSVFTLVQDSNIKLYADTVPDTASNVLFEDIQLNDIVHNAIVYVIAQEAQSSTLSRWVLLTVIDKHRRVGQLRVFDVENEKEDLVGHYVMTDLKRSKFGFQSSAVVTQDHLPLSANPEIDIAKKYIQQAVAEDENLESFCAKTAVIDKLTRNSTDEKYEIGYEAVRVAMEIAYIKATSNITPEVDTKLLIRAAIASRAYLSLNTAIPLSDELKTIIVVTGSPLQRDNRLLCILDTTNEIQLPEKIFLKKLKPLIDALAAFRNESEYRQVNNLFSKGEKK